MPKSAPAPTDSAPLSGRVPAHPGSPGDADRGVLAEDVLALALGSVSDGVVISDDLGRVVYVNPGFTALTGFTLAEASACPDSFGPVPGAPSALLAKVRERLRAGLPVHEEIPGLRHDGVPFWDELIIAPAGDARGGAARRVAVHRNVTERRRLRDALAASQARLQALFDHTHDAILLADDEGRVISSNLSACALLGYDAGELDGLPGERIFDSSERAWRETSWNVFLSAGHLSGECGLRRRDGTSVRAEFNGVARIQPGVHLFLLRDVTERHHMQDRLMRQQRLESVGRLASGVAHDLNNILTPILMAPAILRPYLHEAGARMLLDTVESGARRGSFIVRQLMTFARGEAGEKVALDLRDVVRDVSAIVRETFRKDLSLEAPAPPAAFPVRGDRNQLHQAVLNLALNAADAMSRGGRLVITLERLEASASDVASEPGAKPGPHAVVTVVDHGAGIAPEHLDKIFDPFFTTKPFGQGSGLGLSVVLGIARGHGGFVRITSRLGVGTIARLHVPLCSDPDPSAPAASPAAGQRADGAGAGRVILVVDDEAPVRDVLRNTLTRAGYHVRCAADADAAFAQLRAAPGGVDLVLTDLAMPAVSGAKLIETLRARRPGLPIVVLTGADTDQSLPPALRGVVNGIVAKPCDADTLLAAVAKVFSPAAAS